MNAQLRAKLLSTHRIVKRAPPELRLIGEGLDAIIRRTQRRGTFVERLFVLDGQLLPLYDVKPEHRLLRYLRAKQITPPQRNDELRKIFGEMYRAAWIAGKTPNLRRQPRVPLPRTAARSLNPHAFQA